jgi:predicted transglutaminase-like cysteine proteinase
MRALSTLPDVPVGPRPVIARAGGRAFTRSGSLLFCAGALFAFGMGIAVAASSVLGFSRSVTPSLIKHYAILFGESIRARIVGWQDFVRPLNAPRAEARSGRNERELLDLVNAFFNRTPFVADIEHWKMEDYWASPAEMLASNGGDCEDYSIAKYFALKELGVPVERLRITYVKAIRLNQAHMVLAYYAAPDAEPLILDNLEARVRPAGERQDLIPVYSFNDEDLLLVQPGPGGNRRGSPTQIRLWNALLEKLERELRY